LGVAIALSPPAAPLMLSETEWFPRKIAAWRRRL
jgi:hypothetical protein